MVKYEVDGFPKATVFVNGNKITLHYGLGDIACVTMGQESCMLEVFEVSNRFQHDCLNAFLKQHTCFKISEAMKAYDTNKIVMWHKDMRNKWCLDYYSKSLALEW